MSDAMELESLIRLAPALIVILLVLRKAKRRAAARTAQEAPPSRSGTFERQYDPIEPK